MGFNKRYVSIDSLKKFLENGYSVSKFFDADALFFMDKKSHKIYELYTKGVDDKKLKKIVENDTGVEN